MMVDKLLVMVAKPKNFIMETSDGMLVIQSNDGQ